MSLIECVEHDCLLSQPVETSSEERLYIFLSPSLFWWKTHIRVSLATCELLSAQGGKAKNDRDLLKGFLKEADESSETEAQEGGLYNTMKSKEDSVGQRDFISSLFAQSKVEPSRDIFFKPLDYVVLSRGPAWNETEMRRWRPMVGQQGGLQPGFPRGPLMLDIT